MQDFAPRAALGMMSGTSMDGVDAALVETDGVEILAFGRTAFRPYSAQERAALVAAQGLWPGGGAREEAARLARAEEVLAHAHAEAVAGLGGAAVIGFHGQTLAHDPAAGRTHQAGDGARLARETGSTVVWDFRSADMAAGGQGAPLAPFFHWACARWAGLSEPVAFLNLGGVANVTVADPTAPAPEAPGALLAFDTGPANAPLDDLLAARRGLPFDAGGALAASGRADAGVLAALTDHPWFEIAPPKSLDRHAFHHALEAVAHLSDADAAATLAALPAACLARALAHLPRAPRLWLVSGGGTRNPAVMAALAERLPGAVASVASIGLDADMLEAQAFAYLAVRVLRGLPTSAPGTTGCAAPVCGGRISRPEG